MSRQSRFLDVLREHNASAEHVGEASTERIQRFVLVQKNIGGSGLWELPLYVTTHASLSAVSDYLALEEFPADWEFEALVDLDEGTEYQIAKVITTFEPRRPAT